MAYITIEYNDGGNPLDYKHVKISATFTEGIEKIFDSGDFVKDWFNAIKYFIMELAENRNEFYISHSSSVDHFTMDGAPFDSAYLHVKDGIGELKYVDYDDPDWVLTQRDVYEGGIEIFVPEGTQPTWEELKETCKN